MTTPNFKVLVNAVQLGQPSDPAASIRALVEQMLVQQEEIGHLRRELALLQNRYAALTVVAEPEASSSNPRREAPRSEPPPARQHRVPNLAAPEEGEERNSTIVTTKGGIQGIESRANAPFPIPPAGRLHRRPDPEIPGAPWASTPAPAARPASARPPARERSEEGTWPDEVVLALAQAGRDATRRISRHRQRHRRPRTFALEVGEATAAWCHHDFLVTKRGSDETNTPTPRAASPP
jgi:hypothetical protein